MQLFNQVLDVAEIRVLCGLFMILFLMLKFVMLLLFHVIYVVVVFLVIMATCWCLK